MASKFWIKLYMEILDDPKMGNLDDHLFRRTIELFLLAGDMDNKGFLPTEKDIAWRLRTPIETIHDDITNLVSAEVLDVVEGNLHVKNFAKWQGGIPVTERMKRYREQQKKNIYYDRCNESVTGCNTDKIRIDKNKKKTEIDSADPSVWRDKYLNQKALKQ